MPTTIRIILTGGLLPLAVAVLIACGDGLPPTPSPLPTLTPTVAPTPPPTPTPTATPTATPTSTPTPRPTATPTQKQIAADALSTHIPWFRRPGSFDNREDELLTGMWLRDAESAVAVAQLAWVGDGLLANEPLALRILAVMQESDPATVLGLTRLSWFAESLSIGSQPDDPRRRAFTAGSQSHPRWRAFRALSELVKLSPEAARAVTEAAWADEEMDENEARGVRYLVQLAEQDTALAAALVSAPWFADSLGTNGDNVIHDLAVVAGRDPALARQALGYVSGERLWDRDAFMLVKLVFLVHNNEETLALLREQPWFTDGLSPEERALLAVLPLGELAPYWLDSYFTQSSTITLPLAGEVNLYVFYHDPFPPGDETLELLEQTVRGVEELMGLPFPVTDVIVWILDQEIYHWGSGGRNQGGRSVYIRGAENRVYGGNKVYHRTLFHEVAHYYFLGGDPTWVYEGGAEFIEEHLAGSLGYESQWHPRFPGVCEAHGWENVYVLAALPDAHPYGFGCNYSMGKNLLVALFQAWGEEAFSAALRDLYRWSTTSNYQNQPRDEGEREIYEVLRAHAPPGREDEFRELYRKLNGGPYTVALPPPVPLPEALASRIAEALPWAASPPDGDHQTALQAIARLWQLDPALGGAGAQYPWAVDGVTLTEAVALADLASLAAENLEWGRLVAGYPWVRDEISIWEQLALNSLRRLAQEAPVTSGLVLDQPWVADGINAHSERLFLGSLARVAEARPDAALRMLDIPWNVEELSEGERRALNALGRLAEQDEGALTRRVLGLPWVADGITPEREWEGEAWALTQFAWLLEADPALFEDVLSLPWVVEGGWTRPEHDVVFELGKAANDGLGGFARRLLNLAWVADGIESEEELAFRPFIAIARVDVALARRMADYAWVADDITSDENHALGQLSVMSEVDVALAWRVAGYAWVADGITGTEQRVLYLLRRIGDHRLGWDEFTSYPWIVDSVTDEERARLASLYREALGLSDSGARC